MAKQTFTVEEIKQVLRGLTVRQIRILFTDMGATRVAIKEIVNESKYSEEMLDRLNEVLNG
jgi:hypothetical protein